MHKLSTKRNLFLFIFPSFVMYTVYIITPVFITIYYSFTKYSGIGKPKFIGLKNYVRLLNDEVFFRSLKNSMIIFVLGTLLIVSTAFLLANLLRSKLKITNACRAMIYSPAVIAPIVAGIIWVFILDPEIGFINNLLTQMGLENWRQAWIGGDKLSPYSFTVVFFWRQTGFIATIFIAGLNMIPMDIYESSQIDGANGWQTMRHITIPMLRQTFVIAIILVITASFKVFEVVLQLTNGGPNHLSEVLITYTYNTTFIGGEYGYGMALATAAFLVTMVFSVINLYVNYRKDEE